MSQYQHVTESYRQEYLEAAAPGNQAASDEDDENGPDTDDLLPSQVKLATRVCELPSSVPFFYY